MKITPAVVVALVCAAALQPAHAQTYPNRPIRLIVPYPPGSSTNDILGRALALRLTPLLGQQVVVDNRSGASGNVGSELVAKSVPDGYTLLIGVAGPLAVGPSVYTNLGYVPTRDLAPIAMYAAIPYILVVNPSVPANNIKELIALAKAKPGQLNFASSGSGGSPHLCGELFKSMAGIDIVHIPYKGAGPALTELMAGQVSIVFNNPLGSLPHVRSGRLRGLAISGPRRMAAMPDIPTVAESGLPGFDATFFLGLLGPAGMPRDLVMRLNSETVKIVQRRDVRDWLSQQGMDAEAGTPEEFAVKIKIEMDKLTKVVRDAGIRLN
jgi:tripartite-type tricarboxylate transporter receptor subunit TctC